MSSFVAYIGKSRHPDLTEAEIIKGCVDCDPRCQKELVARYAPILMTVSRRYSKDNEFAKDILQDSFIKIFKNISKYKPIGSFTAWMRRIVINTALQTFDKSCFRKEISGLEDLNYQSSIPAGVYEHLGAEEIMNLVATLPEGFKQVFNLYVVEGLSHKEIAVLLGITESTSRSQLVRARAALRKLLTIQEKIRV